MCGRKPECGKTAIKLNDLGLEKLGETA